MPPSPSSSPCSTPEKQAPGIRLALVNLDPPALARQAEQGDIDLVFHIPDDSPPGLRSRAMFTEHYVLAGRRDHPHLKRRPTLARFCRLEHAIVSPDGGGFLGMTDRVLHRQGLSRNVVLSVPHFGTLLSVLASTDLVAMVPSRLVQNHAALRIQPAPLDIPGFDMHMLWPERLHRDATHQWLRDMIAQEGASSVPPGQLTPPPVGSTFPQTLTPPAASPFPQTIGAQTPVASPCTLSSTQRRATP